MVKQRFKISRTEQVRRTFRLHVIMRSNCINYDKYFVCECFTRFSDVYYTFYGYAICRLCSPNIMNVLQYTYPYLEIIIISTPRVIQHIMAFKRQILVFLYSVVEFYENDAKNKCDHLNCKPLKYLFILIFFPRSSCFIHIIMR